MNLNNKKGDQKTRLLNQYWKTSIPERERRLREFHGLSSRNLPVLDRSNETSKKNKNNRKNNH